MWGVARGVWEIKDETTVCHSQAWSVRGVLRSVYLYHPIASAKIGSKFQRPQQRAMAWHVLYIPLSSCNLWHYKFQPGFAIVDLKPAGLLAGTLKNSYSKCLAYNPRHPSTSTAKLCLLAGVISDWRWKCFLHLIRMPNQSELLHMETGLASLIKLVVAWLSHKCSTSLRINTKKNAKTTQSKGGVYMTSDMSSHRYSQHASLYKRKQGKDPSLFCLSATGHRVQNKATNKTNARKEEKNRENVEKRRRNGHWHTESSIVWSFCSQQQG